MSTESRCCPSTGERVQQAERNTAWLSASEAADYLRFPTRDAFYKAVQRGQVPALRVGPRRLRFHRADLDALIRKGSP